MNQQISITSVSWIEASRLPHAGTLVAIGGTPIIGNWENRVVMGLVATSNPKPGDEINVLSLKALKQYRALTHFKLFPHSPKEPKDIILDPGFTPPFDKSKIATFLVHFAPVPAAAKNFHPGEYSALSQILGKKSHPASTLKLIKDDIIVAGALIKFRAGKTTNSIGISDTVGSPVHVPWVWCEHVLVRSNSKYVLIVNGSRFPSHAWYVNGKKVHTQFQEKISISDKEPAISTGRPKDQPRIDADADQSQGTITEHDYTIPENGQERIDVTRFLQR